MSAATAEPLWRRLAARTYPPHTLRTEPYGGSFRVSGLGSPVMLLGP